jgi:hypothetical protein
MTFIIINKKFCGGPGGGFSKEPPGRRRQKKVLIEFYRSSGWTDLTFFELKDISVHPVDKNMG